MAGPTTFRDDPSPAPWTDEGKAIIEREGYVCIKKNPEQVEGKGTKRKASNDEGEEEILKRRKLYFIWARGCLSKVKKSAN